MSNPTKRIVEAKDLAISLNTLFDSVKAMKKATKRYGTKRENILDMATFCAIEDRYCHTEISKAIDLIEDIAEELDLRLEMASQLKN